MTKILKENGWISRFGPGWNVSLMLTIPYASGLDSNSSIRLFKDAETELDTMMVTSRAKMEKIRESLRGSVKICLSLVHA